MKVTIKNFFIIGKVMGGQRTENLIKLLLDKQHPVYYNSFKNTKQIPSFIHILLTKLSSVLSLLIADVVVMPAMCNNYQFEFKIAKWLNKTILTDFYISLYDTHVLDQKPIDSSGGLIEPNSFTAKKLKKIDRRIIENSDFTFFLNSTEAQYYLKILNLEFDARKHLIVPICTDEKFKCELNYFADNSLGVFNICWWGTYIPLHGLEKIIQSAQVLDKNFDLNFHFHLFGNNEKKSQPYYNLIEDLGLSDRITIYNDRTFNNGKLGIFLQKKCDLVLGNFGDSAKAKNVIVNKIIDGVAMKAPILTGESTAPLEFFSENEIFYTQNDPTAIANSINSIARIKKEEIEKRVGRSYEIFKKHFAIEAYNEKLGLFLDKL